MSHLEECLHRAFCLGAIQDGADRYFIRSWVSEVIRQSDVRAREETQLTGQAAITAKRKKALEMVHTAIHYKQVEPTTSGVSKYMRITRPSAYELLAELVSQGMLRSEPVDSSGRTLRYTSRVMP